VEARTGHGQGKLQRQIHHSGRDRVSVSTTLACATLGSSSAMLTIVMDMKTMTKTERQQVKAHSGAVCL